MTSVSSAELTTTLRPLVQEAERVLARQFSAGAQVPTVPVPRLEAGKDGRGKHWVADEIDWQGLGRLAMSAMSESANVFVAEAIIAQALDLGPHEQGAERKWTPQGQIVDSFLVDYLRRAYDDAADQQMPEWLGKPEDEALEGAADRLTSFLATETFTAAVVAPVRDLDFTGDVIDLDAGVRVLPFSRARREQFWRRFGQGSLSAGGLDSHLILTATHVIEADVSGQKPGGWDWTAGGALIDRAVMALRINAAGSFAASSRLLALPTDFEDYLGRLGAGGGLQTLTGTGRGRRGALHADAASHVRETYSRLGSVDHMSSMGLALRRLAASSERLSDEDRLTSILGRGKRCGAVGRAVRGFAVVFGL